MKMYFRNILHKCSLNLLNAENTISMLVWFSACHGCPIVVVLSQSSCSGCPSSSSCHDLVLLSWPSCHGFLSGLFCPSCPVLTVVLSPICPFYPNQAVLSGQPTCPDISAPVILSQLSCHGCPDMVVLFQLSCPRSHVLAVLSSLSCPDCQPLLLSASCFLQLSYSSLLYQHSYSQLSIPRPVLVVMFWQSCPICPVPHALS
jgi:hypothetical protein